MSYYIEKGEAFSEGASRIWMEQHHKALNALADEKEIHKSIHKARKHFKKLRAIYRLVRDEIGPKRYKAGNVFYRNLGRKLENMRDITSRIETLELLEEQFGHLMADDALKPLLEQFQQERRQLTEAQYEDGQRVDNVIRELQENRERFLELPISDEILSNLLKSITRVYKRGYKGYQNSLSSPSVEEMHEWRKRIKYLWYHHRLLRKAWPKVMNAYRKEIKKLSDYLGDYHDLALLQNKINNMNTDIPKANEKLAYALCEEEKKVLLKTSMKLGSQVYAETPKAFSRRIEGILCSHLI